MEECNLCLLQGLAQGDEVFGDEEKYLLYVSFEHQLFFVLLLRPVAVSSNKLPPRPGHNLLNLPMPETLRQQRRSVIVLFRDTTSGIRVERRGHLRRDVAFILVIGGFPRGIGGLHHIVPPLISTLAPNPKIRPHTLSIFSLSRVCYFSPAAMYTVVTIALTSPASLYIRPYKKRGQPLLLMLPKIPGL